MTEEELTAEFVADAAGHEAQLCVATCPTCTATVFPRQQTCPRCLDPDMRPEVVGGPGELWSWTVQRFVPGPPYSGPTGLEFRPYGVGYVRFGDCVLVEGRLAGDPDADPPRIGQSMAVVVEHLIAAGETYETFAFRGI